jgi:hypothetical protein
MMHFKRKGPKSTRAGCLLCKPHKRQGAKLADRQRHSVNRQLAACRAQIDD